MTLLKLNKRLGSNLFLWYEFGASCVKRKPLNLLLEQKFCCNFKEVFNINQASIKVVIILITDILSFLLELRNRLIVIISIFGIFLLDALHFCYLLIDLCDIFLCFYQLGPPFEICIECYFLNPFHFLEHEYNSFLLLGALFVEKILT